MKKPESHFRQSETTESGQTVSLNKGHFTLDTDERTDEFSRKLATGWEDAYAEYRKNWIDLPKNKEVSEYPQLVDLELVSVCNLNCPMCPTITESFQQRARKGKGMMKMELFKKVIDEIAGKVFAIRLSFVGESTLHKNLIECVEYAHQKGIKEISFLTNGSKLDLPYFEKLAKAGVSWITISIDGTGETYNKIRKPITWEMITKRLKDIKEYKEKNNLVKPVIKVQGVWPAIRENPTYYYESIAPLVDLIAYNPLIDYLHKDSEIVYDEDFSCPQYYQRLVIGSDGNAIMCSNDDEGEMVVGDAWEESIHKIWHGDKMNELREIHSKKGGFKDINVCKKCYYPRKSIPNETAMVGDREITIENYVNRKQEIGQ